MSALTGIPGNSCSLATPPINQNGTEKATTNKKNVRDDLPRNPLLSSSPGCGKVRICGSCCTPPRPQSVRRVTTTCLVSAITSMSIRICYPIPKVHSLGILATGDQRGRYDTDPDSCSSSRAKY